MLGKKNHPGHYCKDVQQIKIMCKSICFDITVFTERLLDALGFGLASRLWWGEEEEHPKATQVCLPQIQPFSGAEIFGVKLR